LAASREELLETARWRRALAKKARELSLEMTNEMAQLGLMQHAHDLERQAYELEIQAGTIAG
jgi:hypothetical protein